VAPVGLRFGLRRRRHRRRRRWVVAVAAGMNEERISKNNNNNECEVLSWVRNLEREKKWDPHRL